MTKRHGGRAAPGASDSASDSPQLVIDTRFNSSAPPLVVVDDPEMVRCLAIARRLKRTDPIVYARVCRGMQVLLMHLHKRGTPIH